MIHEHFCNRQLTATTSLRPAGSPSDPQRTAKYASGPPGLRAPVSPRDSAISRRTVINHAG